MRGGGEGWPHCSVESVNVEGENELRWKNNLAVPGVHSLTEGMRRNGRRREVQEEV